MGHLLQILLVRRLLASEKKIRNIRKRTKRGKGLKRIKRIKRIKKVKSGKEAKIRKLKRAWLWTRTSTANTASYARQTILENKWNSRLGSGKSKKSQISTGPNTSSRTYSKNLQRTTTP